MSHATMPKEKKAGWGEVGKALTSSSKAAAAEADATGLSAGGGRAGRTGV